MSEKLRILATSVLVMVVVAVVATPGWAIHKTGGGQTPTPTPTPAPAPPVATPPPAQSSPEGLAGLIASLFGRKPAAQPTTPAAPAPTTTTLPAPVSNVPTMQVGSSGELVRRVEQRLDALKYFVGAVDGQFDEDTKQAVLAFQKVHGTERTGSVNTAVFNALQRASDPGPIVPNGGPHRVEVDLTRQVLFLYEGGKLAKIIAVSSGTSSTPTPTGDYKIYHQSTGWETSALGRLYNSQYFIGGYAIHGSLSVPAEPASHGCVRLPMSAADWFPEHVRIGTPVYVR